MVWLNPVLNGFTNLALHRLDRVATGRYNFFSVVSRSTFLGAQISRLLPCAACVVTSVITQFSDHVKFKSTS